MSFVDIRKFVATMSELGYPRSLSMDSFRSPNFECMADCLHWLIMRYDPVIDLQTNITTDVHRVFFIKRATEIMLSSARIKLNPRHLYSADGYAVKELLKVALLLQNATNTVTTKPEHEEIELGSSIKAFDVKATRQLVNEIAKHGSSLYDVLDSEPTLHESRMQATMMNTNMDEIDKGLREAINTMLKSVSSAQQDQELAKNDEEALQIKVEKREFELERSEERLSTLHNVKPAYMDKYEALQKDLHELFVVYSKKSRNLQWLKSQMEEHNKEEQEILNEADWQMRRLQRRQHEEELSILRGEEVGAQATNLGSSEESDGEGAMLWKWFDGNSFKTILDPHAKSDQIPPQSAKGESSRSLTKGTIEWMRHSQDGLNALANPRLNPNNSSNYSTLNITNDAFEVEDCFKRQPSESAESFIDAPDISGDLEEVDGEPLDTNDFDLKGSLDDNSSDDDF